MKTKSQIMIIVFVLFTFVFARTLEKQKPEWKGKIEIENGVKVAKNPREPLYGEIEFELEEDLSIGRAEDNYLFFNLQSSLLM